MEQPTLRFGRVQVFLGDKNGKYPDGNQVVVHGSDTKVAFDTPLVATRLREELQDTELVVLGHVHEDHTCALHMLPDAAVLAPQADLAAVQSVEGMLEHYGYSERASARMRTFIAEKFFFRPRPDARGYAPGQEWDVGGSRIRAIHMPGHTGGHSVLLVEPEGVAFIGDIDLTGFGPYYGDACSSLADFRRSLERVAQVEARVWVTSHHKGVITERETFLAMLAAFTEKVHQREQAILAALADGGRTLEALVAQRFLFPPGYDGIYADDAERKTIREHLDSLLAEGRIWEENGTYRTRQAG